MREICKFGSMMGFWVMPELYSIRKIRRNVRNRSGNIATGNILTWSGEQLALFQNIGNEEYILVVFGSKDIYSVFGKHRKPERREGMTRKEIHRNAETGRKMICNGELRMIHTMTLSGKG